VKIVRRLMFFADMTPGHSLYSRLSKLPLLCLKTGV
jgi:hypothetical protein